MANATLVLGAMWGDEGKGKMIDVLASKAELCLRAQGGHNAGHTIVTNGITYDVHLIPSGVLNPKCINLVGSGCAVHVPSFFKELETLKSKGVDVDNRVFISDRAHLDFDLHQAVDGCQERELGDKSIGTTKKGIGPCFASKATRSGAMLSDIFVPGALDSKLRNLESGYRKRYGDLLEYNVDEEITKFKGYAEQLRDFVVDETTLLNSAKQRGSFIVVEGAQATMLDITYGTYPFVTSSNCTVGGILAGISLGWRSIREVIGVVKAYTTRVGSGPFPTEQLNDVGSQLQSIGKEVGVTTGRKRRTGHLDLMVARYSHHVNDYTALNLTKLDILDSFDEIPVAVGYSYNGEALDSFPASLTVLENIKVEYKVLPGWKSSTSGVQKWEDLPPRAQEYVKFVEDFVGVKIKYIGTGPRREDMIYREGAVSPL